MKCTTSHLSFLLFAIFSLATLGNNTLLQVHAQDADVAAAESEAASDSAPVRGETGTKTESNAETGPSDHAAAEPVTDTPSTPDDASDGDKHEDEDKDVKDTAKTAEATNANTTPPPKQSGPFIDLFGENLLSLKMVDETHAQIETHLTNEALAGKKVIGVYFSADWCGPCRQFTPELVSFYDKINKRRGKKDQFEIIWVSRCRDVQSFGQYFTHMKWLALPPEEALGQRGQKLGELFKTKGIPHLVLLDEVGNVITYDARNKLPADRSGIGFPWRNPLATLYVTLVPKSLRFLVKAQVDGVKNKILGLVKKRK